MEGYIDNSYLVMKGMSAVVAIAESELRKEAVTLTLKFEIIGADEQLTRAYEIDVELHRECRGASVNLYSWARRAAKNIDGLTIFLNIDRGYLYWDRIKFFSELMEEKCTYPSPLYAKAFSLYADSCFDIEWLSKQDSDLFAALDELSDRVSLVDDYDELFPEFARSKEWDEEFVDNYANWTEEDHEWDEDRALAEQDYGGWWLTWKDSDESNIEQLQSGKVLIGLLGKLHDACKIDVALPPNYEWLLDWIPAFVNLVDKYQLWDEEDDIDAIRLGVAWCEEVEIRSCSEIPVSKHPHTISQM